MEKSRWGEGGDRLPIPIDGPGQPVYDEFSTFA